MTWQIAWPWADHFEKQRPFSPARQIKRRQTAQTTWERGVVEERTLRMQLLTDKVMMSLYDLVLPLVVQSV